MPQQIKIADIVIGDRQRKDMTPSELLELKRSIAHKGLFHAIILSEQPDGSKKLLAGERRLTAIKQLMEEGTSINYNGEKIALGYIPYITISTMSLADLEEAELEENIIRANLSWLEEIEAKAKIHELRAQVHPFQTVTDVARDYVAKTGGDPAAVKSNSPVVREYNKALLINKHKNDPAVAGAKTAAKAHKIILDKMEAAFKSKLAQNTILPSSPHTLIKGDCVEVMKTLPSNSIDIIFSDPPYGINADTAKKDSNHQYDDSPENALAIYKHIIVEGFRLCKPKGSLLLFCDIDFFLTLRNYAYEQGWTPWRTPIIMAKGENGHAPWGRAGFVRTYELLFYAVKGQKELYAPGGPDVKVLARLAGFKYKRVKAHGAEKPSIFLEHMLRSCALTGDTVLDPCCGSGQIFVAAQNLDLKAIGIELDTYYHDLAVNNIAALQEQEKEVVDPDDDDLEALL